MNKPFSICMKELDDAMIKAYQDSDLPLELANICVQRFAQTVARITEEQTLEAEAAWMREQQDVKEVDGNG